MFTSKVSKETTFHKMSLRQEGSTANSRKKCSNYKSESIEN